jgi:hypothetical protein
VEPASSIGRHVISARLTAKMRVLAVGYCEPSMFLEQYATAIVGKAQATKLAAFLG